MTLDEAIEVQIQERKDHHSFYTDIVGQAEQLLIEAGKWRVKQKADGYLDLDDLLPGETKE